MTRPEPPQPMLSRERGIEDAVMLMMAFAERTGLTSQRQPRRYLWTDAFAVCNFLGLARATGDDSYTALALRLVDQVHATLGRFRSDDRRKGWLSGLPEQEGQSHPTRGGLRIGKKLPERRPEEPFNEGLEWDRDGQYFHYLTRWMHALDQVSRVTRQPRFNTWARELALAAHRAFATGPVAQGARRMVWKMSTDLTRPLVPSMGQHDPLDGVITYTQLQATASTLAGTPGEPDVAGAAADFATMTEGRDWLTPDPLGLGGLMMDACRVEQLMRLGLFSDGRLLDTLLAVAVAGLPHYVRDGLRAPPSQRLAFRELGLAIGLHAIELTQRNFQAYQSLPPPTAGIPARLEAFAPYLSVGKAIEAFWLVPENRGDRTWSEHCDINDVMLATSLVPEGCLVLTPTDGTPVRAA